MNVVHGSGAVRSGAEASQLASDERIAGAAFEAILLQAAFAPLAKAMGFYGDVVVAAATRSIVRLP